MFDGVSVVWRQADVDMLVGEVARPTWYRETSGVPGRRSERTPVTVAGNHGKRCTGTSVASVALFAPRVTGDGVLSEPGRSRAMSRIPETHFVDFRVSAEPRPFGDAVNVDRDVRTRQLLELVPKSRSALRPARR